MKIQGFWTRKRKQPSPSSPKRKSKQKNYIPPLVNWHPQALQVLDWCVTFSTVILLLLMLLTRFPGMELLGIGPNWLLIWVVAWSVKRSALEGAVAGVVLGLLQDAMTAPHPTHALGLGVVGLITGLLQKQRFIQEDFISIALIVFGMSLLTETIFALQLIFVGDSAGADLPVRNPEYIWTYYQRIALASAILSSLWAPVVYFPLNRWWQKLKLAAQVTATKF
ncbi:MAG: rod shape-determining protein MreD [Richelia sp.]|nr:rod shape-determining protein MreD [Richelia sp.]CDN17108.1 Rod shape-determining protein MreD [Richelia intracellularis]